MPMYDANTVYQDPILTDFSVGFEDQSLFGTRLAPITEVGLPSAQYRVFDRSDWVLFPDRREPGSVANEVRGRKWSVDSYQAKEHSLQAAVTDEERSNVAAANQSAASNLQAGIEPEQDATELITRAILLRHEQIVSTAARTAANYGSQTVTLAGTSQWSDYTGTSDPFKDIQAAVRSIYTSTRQMPNLILIPWEVWTWMEHHPKVISRYQYFQIEPTPETAIKALTSFPDGGTVLLADSNYNAADNIDATESITSFWGKDVIVARVDTAGGQNTRTFMKTFAVPYNGEIRAVDRWREEPRKSDVIRCSMKYDVKLVSALAGYLIKSAVA